MKKGVHLILFSLVLACVILAGSALPASAAAVHATKAAIHQQRVLPAHRWHRWPWRWYRFHEGYGYAPREINQLHVGNSDFNNPKHYVGHGLANDGNSGYNRGLNEDNDSSDGNQIINSDHLLGFHRVNQAYFGDSNFNKPSFYQGYNSGNDGNSGTNDGLNQDNSSNGGNQIIG